MRPAGQRVAAACFVALFAAVLTGCPVGPDFVKPDPPLPAEYRSEIEPATAASFADLPWWDVFDDEVLRALVTEGLQNNYDLRTAVFRVEQAAHQVGIARSEIYPQAGYAGGAQRGKTFIGLGGDNVTLNSFLGSLNLAWEIDVWGRIRRASEAAMAELLATNDFRRAVVLSLVSGIAAQYFQLQELDLELDIARRTTESFDETVALFSRRYSGGVDTKLSVERAKAARGVAAAAIPRLEQAIVIQENAICVLLGRPPGSVPRQALLTRAALPPQAPPGLPSDLLRRRPDILQAEEFIRSANAEIGINVANFFPRIGLTTLYGGQSSDIENVVKTPGVIWAIAGSMMGPLFQGGRLIESYRGSVANWEASKQQYEQTVVTALAEVANALIAQQKLEQVRAEQLTVVDALRESVRLALLRYNGGLAMYFEVLEAQQQLFPAENALAQTDRDRLLAVIDLYRALGGGWEADDGTPIEVPWWPAGP